MIIRAFRDKVITRTKKKLVERTYEYWYVRSGTRVKGRKKKQQQRLLLLLLVVLEPAALASVQLLEPVTVLIFPLTLVLVTWHGDVESKTGAGDSKTGWLAPVMRLILVGGRGSKKRVEGSSVE